MSIVVLIAGGLMVVIALVLLAMVFIKARQVNLTQQKEGKQDWMHAMPPQETVDATTQDGEGVTLYDHDEGEKLATPFAEQIEDVLRVRAASDPYLKSFEIDFGTAPDGSLEIWVNGKKYDGVANLPDEKLKQVLLQAVKDWNSRK